MDQVVSPQQPRGPIVLAILIITLGVGWLLTALGYAPEINWVWTLCLGVIGILAFILSGGLDKVSIIVGPFFLVSSVLSILRQTQRLSPEVEIPLLVILIGVLLLVAQLRCIPLPSWILLPPGDRSSAARP